jgi:Tfp pilus assembly protein PilF
MQIGKKKQQQVARFMAAAQRLNAQGYYQRAVETAVKAIDADENCLPAYRLIAAIQIQHRNFEPALWAADEALKRAPHTAEVLFESATAHRGAGNLQTALAHAEQARAIEPQMANLEGFIVHLLTLLGRDAEARQRLERAVDAMPEDVGITLMFGEWAARLGRVPEAISRLESRLAGSVVAVGSRCDMLFMLARLCDLDGQYDRAFAAVHQARQLLPSAWDPAAYDRAVVDICRHWSAECIAHAPRATHDASRVVLIVGMPRSGTTLVEQVFARHPRVAAGGELPHLGQLAIAAAASATDLIPFQRHTLAVTAQVVTQIGIGYLDATAALARGVSRVTDKMPANHAHLGLAELALPGTRVIHCRRDPRDTALSCYFTPLGAGLGFTSDLRHIGRYALAEQRLMAHWKSCLSLPILTVDYEALVGDFAGHARRLIDFVGLDWNPDCLQPNESPRFVDTASALQVRQPVYSSSIGRWRHYEKHLGPLFETLGSEPPPPGR